MGLAPGGDGNLGWTLRQVIFQCILMTLESSATLTDRFTGTRRVLRQRFRGSKAPGKTYQGLVKARQKISGKPRRYLKKHLRDCHRRIARDLRVLSTAEALRTIREAMTETKRWRRKGDPRVLLKKAVKDGYVRNGSKKAPDWPHKKNDPPAGSPKIRPATKKEKDKAKKSYEKKSAA